MFPSDPAVCTWVLFTTCRLATNILPILLSHFYWLIHRGGMPIIEGGMASARWLWGGVPLDSQYKFNGWPRNKPIIHGVFAPPRMPVTTRFIISFSTGSQPIPSFATGILGEEWTQPMVATKKNPVLKWPSFFWSFATLVSLGVWTGSWALSRTKEIQMLKRPQLRFHIYLDKSMYFHGIHANGTQVSCGLC